MHRVMLMCIEKKFINAFEGAPLLREYGATHRGFESLSLRQNCAPVAQLDRVPGYEPGGREFESLRINREALDFLKGEYAANAALKSPEKLAVVFDIDETLLSSAIVMQHYGFGGDQKLFDNMVQAATSTAIVSTCKLYHWAAAHHIALFLITGRPGDLRMPTIQNLHHEGVYGWQGLYFWPRHSQLTVKAFKSAMRTKVTQMGYDIVINIGDQMSDLEGGGARRSFKLPNPFYQIASDHRRS